MSEDGKRDLGRDITGLVLFATGVFPTVVLILWMKESDGSATTGFGPAVARGIAGAIGAWPALVGVAAVAALGAAVFVSRTPFSVTRQVVGVIGLAFGLSLLLGGLEPAAGGGLGGGLASALPPGWGNALVALLGAVVLAVTLWTVWLPRAADFSEKGGELSPIAAAVRQEEWDGVSPAEAAALIPSSSGGAKSPSGGASSPAGASTTVVPLPRRSGSQEAAKPATAKPARQAGKGAGEGNEPAPPVTPVVAKRPGAAAPTPSSETHERSGAESPPAPAGVPGGTAAREEGAAEPAGSDLAAGGARSAVREAGRRSEASQFEAAREELRAKAGVRPLSDSSGVRGALPMQRPSWETATPEEATPEEASPEGVRAEASEEPPAEEAERAAESPAAPSETVSASESSAGAPPTAPWEQASLFAEDEPSVDDLYAAIEVEDEAEPSLLDGEADEGLDEIGEEPDGEEAEVDEELDDEEAEDVELEEDDYDEEVDEDEEEYEDEDYDEEDGELEEEDPEQADPEEDLDGELDEEEGELDEEEGDLEDDEEEVVAEDELEEEASGASPMPAAADAPEPAAAKASARKSSAAEKATARKEAPSEEATTETPPAQAGAQEASSPEAPSAKKSAPKKVPARKAAPEEPEVPPAAPTKAVAPDGVAPAEPEVVLQPAPPAAGPAAQAVDPSDVLEGPVEEERVFEAGCLILDRGRVAVSLLQREFGIDFDSATAILDRLQAHGLIGPYLGGRHRDILLSREEWDAKAPTRAS